MNMTIIKSTTVVTLVEDYKFQPRRDGGFDTAVVNFYNTNNGLVDIYDRVTIDGVQWRVAETPRVRVNYTVSPDWLYTLSLVEPVVVLDGVQMPSVAFTQNLAQTRTFADAINSILNKAAVLRTGESRRYNLVTTPSVSLTGIAPDDTFESQSLYGILKYYADALDCKVTLDGNDRIDFIPLNDYTATLTPTFTSIEKSRSMVDYATDIIVDTIGADVDTVVGFPNRHISVAMLPLDFGGNISFDNATLRLPHKIKKILSIEGLYYNETSPGVFEELEAFGTFEYGTRIFELTEWETLAKTTFWSFITNPLGGTGTRDTTVYYEYGKYEINNLKIIQAIINPAVGSFALRLRVTYEVLPDIQISRSSGVVLDGNIRYTERQEQNAKAVNYKLEAQRVEYDLRNKQGVNYNVTWIADTLPSIRSRVAVLTDYALITEMVAERVGAKYEVNAKLTTEYNKRSPLTKIVRENPLFEIPTDQSTERKVVWSDNAVITVLHESLPTVTGRWTNYNWGLFLNVATDNVDDYGVSLFARFEYATQFNGTTYIAVVMPTINIVDGDTIITQCKMTTNTAVDYQRLLTALAGSTASAAIVTDANGENKSVLFKYIAGDGTTVVAMDLGSNLLPISKAYPFVDGEYFADGYYDTDMGYRALYPIFDELQLFKDRREQLVFEHKLPITAGTTTTVNVTNLLAASKLIRQGNATMTMQTVIGGTTYTATITGYVSTTGYLRVNFTYPATGNMTLIRVLLDGAVVFSKTVTAAAQLNESSFITINIGE